MLHDDILPIDRSVSVPARLRVTVWDRPSGGFDVWLDALALDADCPTLEEAANALVVEVRVLADHIATSESLRVAPNWRRRGPFALRLATLDDAQIRRLFDFQVGGDTEPHLDA